MKDDSDVGRAWRQEEQELRAVVLEAADKWERGLAQYHALRALLENQETVGVGR